MPPFNEEAVKADIAADAVGAISIDTSVFDSHRCNLDAQVLQSLGQFRGTRTSVLLSEVVVGEVSGHIERNAEEARAKLKAALGLVRKAWRNSVDVAAVNKLLGIHQTPSEFARRSIAQFIRDTGIEIVEADGLVGHSEVLGRYFAFQPPFSRGELKKYEFPDALALLSIEAWASRNTTRVLLVSRDKDWQAFAEQSEHLVAVPDLSVVLDYFNGAAAFTIARCMTLLASDEQSELKVGIDGALELFLETFDPEIDAYSTLDYEIDNLEPAVQFWTTETDARPRIVKADDEVVVFVLSVNAIVQFSATFRYFVHDGIDREIVDLGTDIKVVEEKIALQVVISMDRRIEEEPHVRSVEVEPRRISIAFGLIDPDWGNEV